MGRHTQKAKPVQGVGLTIVHTKLKHTQRNPTIYKPTCIQLHLATTKQNITTGYINGHVNIDKGSARKILGMNH